MSLINLQSKLEAVARMGPFDPQTIQRFKQFIEQAPDEALFRTNPLRYAQAAELSEARAIDLFVHATHAGLFELSWGAICGGCGAFLHSPEGLRALASDRTCDMCEVAVPGVLDETIEVAFTVTPSIRRLRFHDPEKLPLETDGMFMHFSTSVAFSDETLASFRGAILQTIQLGPRATWVVETELDPPRLALIAPEFHAIRHLPIREGAACVVDLDFLNGRFVTDAEALGPGKKTLRIHNRLERTVSMGLLLMPPKHEATECPLPSNSPTFRLGPFLSGKRVLTSQSFRDLFRAESVPGVGGMALRNLTVLFTDLKSSTELYERIGDLRAYALVRDHFELLRELVASRGGAVVKTIGDAIMASFAEPTAALDAAAAMNREIGRVGGGEDLVLKIGVHAGPCIAVESNDRLDYFGQTVNIAARVQGIAAAREIVCTQPVYDATGATDVLHLAGLAATRDQAMLKGVDGTVTVFRLR